MSEQEDWNKRVAWAETNVATWTCEVCALEKVGTAKQAYDDGWDVPPWFSSGSIKCGSCPIYKTAWWILLEGLK